MRLLVAVDGSTCTERVLAHLVLHDGWLGRKHRYTVVHCVEPLPLRVRAYLEADVQRMYCASESAQVFAPVRHFVERHGLDATFVSKVGSPAQTIAAMADDEGFDMIVMGSRGHGALGGLVMGSVATRVVALSKTPVLIVR